MFKVKMKNKQPVKIEGWTTGLYNFEPMELSKWDEQPYTSQYNTIQWAALRYAAIAFLEANKENLFLDNIESINSYNSFQGGALYLNAFEGYYCCIDSKELCFKRITYTTDGRIIIIAYEFDKNGEPTGKERAWLLD